MSTEAKDSIRVVSRALDILHSFNFEHKEQTLSQICERTGLRKTTVYRILATLEEYNVVIRNADMHKYRLGYEMIRAGAVASSSNTLEAIAHEQMIDASVATKQTCNLYIRDGMERICAAQIMGTQFVWRYSSLGARGPLYCGSGKLLLAYSDEEFLDEYFRKVELVQLTENTITKEAALRKELEQIRKNGYAVARGERSETSAMVGVPVYDYRDMVIAELTVAGPIFSFSDENVQSYVEILQREAQKISHKIGYSKT